MLRSAPMHRGNKGPAAGGRVKPFGAGQHLLSVAPARNEHRAVTKQRGGVQRARNVHALDHGPGIDSRVVDLRRGLIYGVPSVRAAGREHRAVAT